MDGIKNCPFCGMNDEAQYVNGPNGGVIFQCQWCGAQVNSQDDWNTRPLEDALAEKLRDLLAACKAVVEWTDEATLDMAIEAAKAAIAKAEGRTE